MLASAGIVPIAAAHDDIHGRPHFKGPPASPTAVMRAFSADVQSAQALAAVTNTACVDGLADSYPCRNVDLLAFLPLAEIGAGGPLGAANDIWGWTDPVSAREFALVGRNDGTAFVEVTDPVNPVYFGRLPTHTSQSSWRDIKVFADHAFIVSEASGHGMQVFDLTALLSADPAGVPYVFVETAQYNGFGNAHNIVINEQSGFAYAVGTSTCSGGLHMVDINILDMPAAAGCFSGDGYTHDAQCVVYIGPDPNFPNNEEICLASNEDTLTIVDVTDKGAPAQLSRTGYADHGYTHQSWLSEDQRLLFLDDEADELDFGHGTRTRVWDVTDLTAPQLIDTFTNATRAIDHNQYVMGDLVFQANYRSGLRVLEIVRDGNGDYLMLDEIGYFDIYPSSDSANFNGAWSTYPYFPSGTIVVSGIEQGLFVLALNVADEVAFVSPLDNGLASGTSVSIEIFASDGDFDAAPPTVQWGLAGGSWQATTDNGAGIYTANWDTQGLSDGLYDLAARITDQSGVVTSATITVQLNNSDSPPIAGFTSPGDGDTISGNITLVAAASDDGTVVSVTFYDGGVAIGTDSDPSDGLSIKWNTKRVGDGSHILTVGALDDSGRTSDPATDSNGTITVTVGGGNGGGGNNGGSNGGGKGCNPRKDPDCTK